MSKFEFKRGKRFKIDDTFFKDDFDITGIEDNIYNQMAKTMARNVDIESAKTPLVDILTGYTRYKEAEYESQQKRKQINDYEKLILKIERYLNCYQYFLETQEENNKKIANMIHEFETKDSDKK